MNEFPDIKKIESCQTFAEVLEYTAEVKPDNIFLIQGNNNWNYREFNQLVDKCCYYFDDLGLKKGDIISVILRNSIDYLVVYFAALRKRVILNPFPYHLNAQEVLSKVELIEPKIIFCHKGHFSPLSEGKYQVINLDDIEGILFINYIKKYDSKKFQYIEAEKTDTAVMYYSSGTTGNPKIIEYSHLSMVLMQALMLRAGFIKSSAIHLCVLPLGHTASLRYTIKPCICTGSTVVLYESFWKIRSNLWTEIERLKVTFFEIVPSILIAILNTPYKEFSVEQVKSLEFIGCGSSFLPKNIQDAFEDRFKVQVANLYGLSETGATHFDNPLIKGRVTGSIGRPFDIVSVKIFDEQGRDALIGQSGEIAINGIGVFKGYYKNQSLYEESFKDGYFLTGDIGSIDSDGLYYYIDRKKDLIIKGGINIVPSQIEEVILGNKDISEVAVIGKADMFLGEVVKAIIVCKEGYSVDISQLKELCKEKLGDFKCPSEFEIIDELPKGPSGKILKKLLRQREFEKSISGK